MRVEDFIPDLSHKRYTELCSGRARIKSRQQETEDLEELKAQVRYELKWYVGKTKPEEK